MAQLFEHIERPLAKIFPNLGAEDRALLTRGLFSSVHGIVFLGLNQANSSVMNQEIDRMITLVLRQLTAPD